MKKLQGYISKNILNKSEQLKQVSHAYRASVDPALYRHCIPVDLIQSTLIFTCKSALWANKLKLLSASIITGISNNQFKNNQLPISQLKTRVDPGCFSDTDHHRQMEALSTSNIQSLKSLAASVTHNKLQVSLQKLVASSKKTRNKP